MAHILKPACQHSKTKFWYCVACVHSKIKLTEGVLFYKVKAKLLVRE